MTLNDYLGSGFDMPVAFGIVPPLRDGGLTAAQLFRCRYGERNIFTGDGERNIFTGDEAHRFEDYFDYYAELYCPIYADRIKALKEVMTQFLEDSDTVKTVTEDTENLRAAPNGAIAQSYSMGGTQRGATSTVTSSGGSSGDPARLAAINGEIRNLYDEFFRKFEPLFPEVW